jgi:hypothetical protein
MHLVLAPHQAQNAADELRVKTMVEIGLSDLAYKHG